MEVVRKENNLQNNIYIMFKNLFDIPIYRISFEKREKELEREKEKYFQLYKENDQLNYWTREKTDKYFNTTKLRSWKYNEIIWYIMVYIDWISVYGESYLMLAKRIGKYPKQKNIQFNGKAFDIKIEKRTNDKILQEILNEIKEQTKDFKKKDRYLDLEWLKNIGKYVNREKIISD